MKAKNFKPLEWVKEVPKFHCPQMKSSKTTKWETKLHSIQNVPAPKTPTLEPTTREKRIWAFPLFENFFPSSNNTSKGKEYNNAKLEKMNFSLLHNFVHFFNYQYSRKACEEHVIDDFNLNLVMKREANICLFAKIHFRRKKKGQSSLLSIFLEKFPGDSKIPWCPLAFFVSSLPHKILAFFPAGLLQLSTSQKAVLSIFCSISSNCKLELEHEA